MEVEASESQSAGEEGNVVEVVIFVEAVVVGDKKGVVIGAFNHSVYEVQSGYCSQDE